MNILKKARHDSAVEVLKAKGPCRASDLGWFLWGENETRGGEGSHRHNKYCRSAGKLLRQLEREGRVYPREEGTSKLWTAIK